MFLSFFAVFLLLQQQGVEIGERHGLERSAAVMVICGWVLTTPTRVGCNYG
jgi:hypothetical protein